MYNSKGEKKAGHEVWFSGEIDGKFWSTNCESTADGTYTILAPHGLEGEHMSLMTNEHSALLHRKTKDAPLDHSRTIQLGTLDRDVKGIEIIRYEAPVILIKPTTKDGRPLKDARVSVNYVTDAEGGEGRYILKGGVHSDVNLEKQDDGRFRTSQLAPDREVNVTVQADGFEPSSRKVKLAEGKTQEVELTLVPK
jgi:hypothetical protein